MMKLKIGDNIRHLKRGSVYRVVGKTVCSSKVADNDMGFFSVCADGHGEQYCLLHHAALKAPQDTNFLFQVDLTFQVSMSGRTDGATFLIYTNFLDGKTWARPEDEFTEDRFGVAV